MRFELEYQTIQTEGFNNTTDAVGLHKNLQVV